MRNSFARERTPHYCQHSRYTPGVGVEGCKRRHEHDGKHSFEESDEESDMQACDGTDICPAEFHNLGCRTDYRETIQSAPSHNHLGADGTLTTTHADGSHTVTKPNGRTVTYPAPTTETTALAIHTSEGGRAEVSHHTAGGMETIDFIYAKLGIDGGHDYVLGNILKYAARAKYKGQFESDIEKIRNYAVIMQEQEAKRDKQEGRTNG